jgi:asparagine synthase (glutamine-hydrolysing)
MCGIAGIVAGKIDRVHHLALKRMTDALAHRGPDGEGQRGFASCLLGHRRLAIVDVAGGAQPMSGTDERVAVTFNGEIYGYQELRRALFDYPFRTKSDTEVILALYQRYGSRTAERLPGMFAFAIWDDTSQELYCARDRFGEKPLYYATGNQGEFIFASEIKAILASRLVTPVLDPKAVARYLQRQCARPHQSIYANIHALPPACCLRLHDGRIDIRRYWSFPAIESDIRIDDAVDRFRGLLAKAVSRQLVADVPVGAFLSGGLDSSTICSVARGLAHDLRTFSFDFEGGHSEAAYARAAAEAYRTRHVELAARDIDVAQQLLCMQAIYDEPFGDTSTIPTYLLSKEARRHVKVAMTGDGGDELFGGYYWYKPLLWMQQEGRIGFLRWLAARIRNRVYRVADLPGAPARELRIMGLAYARQHASIRAAHMRQLAQFTPADLELLGLKDESAVELDQHFDERGTVDDAIRLDVEDYMPSDILTKIDRASMAHGLELRAPFLDMDFASFCLSLPYRLKLSNAEDKIILREAFAAHWPASVRTRSKQGFGAPLTRWLRDPKIGELEERFLGSPDAPIFQIIAYDGAQQILRRRDPMHRWTLLVLGAWLAQVDSTPGASAFGRIQDKPDMIASPLPGAVH